MVDNYEAPELTEKIKTARPLSGGVNVMPVMQALKPRRRLHALSGSLALGRYSISGRIFARYADLKHTFFGQSQQVRGPLSGRECVRIAPPLSTLRKS